MQAHEMETKLRNAIKNQNTKILKIEDFNKAGINGVEFHNIKIVSNNLFVSPLLAICKPFPKLLSILYFCTFCN